MSAHPRPRGGGGAAIGSAVAGAAANQQFFANAALQLAQDPALFFDTVAKLWRRTHDHGDTNPATAAQQTVIRNSTANVAWMHILGSAGGPRAAWGWTTVAGDDYFNAYGANGWRLLAGANEKLRGSSLGVALFPQIAYVGGTIKSFQADASHDGTGTDVFYTHSIAAASMATNGDRVDFDYTVTFGANANTKQVLVVYGATTVYDSGAVAKNGGSLRVFGTIWRTGAATQRWTVTAVDDASTTRYPTVTGYGTAAETLSGAVALELRGVTDIAAGIVAKVGEVKFCQGI